MPLTLTDCSALPAGCQESESASARCTGNGCSDFAEIATVGANVTSFSDTGLSRFTIYTYRVRAFNDAGNSGYSNTAASRTRFF